MKTIKATPKGLFNCLRMKGLTSVIRRSSVLYLIFALIYLLPGYKSFAQTDKVVQEIQDEGLNRSQLEQTLVYLTESIGPRLTGSPAMQRASNWTRDRLSELGLDKVHLESWGRFLPAWTLNRFSAQVIGPRCIPLIAFPKAWSPGLPAPLEADAVYFDAANKADLEKYHGKLRGKIILNGGVRKIGLHFDPDAKRLAEKDLLRLSNAPGPIASHPVQQSSVQQTSAKPQSARLDDADKAQFFLEEGAAVIIEAGSQGDGGTLFVDGPTLPRSLRSRASLPDEKEMLSNIVPQIIVAVEQYNSMVRMVQGGGHVRLAIDLSVQFEPAAENFNTIGEIHGTDLADQMVMIGAHLDSLHSATGATDNAAGVATVIEAMRILKTLDLAPRRTIRVALWGGEEEGMRGSHVYVEQHFGKMEGNQLVPKADYEKLSAYYNIDYGSGKIRGVYLQGIERAYPVFREWLAPFHEWGADNLTLSEFGSSDQASFNALGLPGFFFMQDELERSRTHHSNQDLFDRVQIDELKQNAIIMAVLAFRTAMSDERMPRRALSLR
jgi:carboxypeptidase Q